jgi:hypothetical protein
MPKRLTDAERETIRLARIAAKVKRYKDDPEFREAMKKRGHDRRAGAELKPRGRRPGGVYWKGGSGVLGDRMRAEMAASRLSVAALSVLSPGSDMYQRATVSGHRDAKWFADHLNLVAPDGRVTHLRGFHYLLVSSGDVLLPSGMLYINNADSAKFLNTVARSARWLGYVPFERIIDNRNDEPLTILPETLVDRAGFAVWSDRDSIELPDDFAEWSPDIHLSGGNVTQPYRIILIGEKSSLRSELEPIRDMVNGELILPTGELSDKLIYDMAARAAEDSRPSVVLYFSDFDPSGYQMPVSLSRKLQALRDIKWPHLEIKVHSAALTLEQCLALDLPSTPLKETELRSANWQAKFGREQTEIDALAALHPGELRRIAIEAVAPFFDFTLAQRVAEAEADWHEVAQQVLDDSPEYRAELVLFAERKHQALATIQDAIKALNAAQVATMKRLAWIIHQVA